RCRATGTRSCSAGRSPPCSPPTCRARWRSPCWTCAGRPPSPAAWWARPPWPPGATPQGRWWRFSARPARAAACPRPPPGGPGRAGSSAWGPPRPRPPRRARAARPAGGGSRARRDRGGWGGGGPAGGGRAPGRGGAGWEGGAVLATADGGTVVFFSMATSFTAAALGAEGVAADVTMLIGNGYVPGHARLALDLVRAEPGVRALVGARVSEGAPGDGRGKEDA